MSHGHGWYVTIIIFNINKQLTIIKLYSCSESGDEADDEKEKPAVESLTMDASNTEPVAFFSDKHYVKTLRLTSEELVSVE